MQEPDSGHGPEAVADSPGEAEAQDASSSSLRRVVLLGASNLTMSLPVVLNLLRGRQPGPLDVFTAEGHGRSFGIWSKAFGRELPGILECGLWDALRADNSGIPVVEPEIPAKAKRTHTAGLITDVGNDLIYGVPPEQLIEWVEACLERMKQHCDAITVVLPPWASICRLGERRFEFFRRLIFPSHTVTFPEIVQNVKELHGRMLQLANFHGATVVDPLGEWYGTDPIHVRWSKRGTAWRSILDAWFSSPIPSWKMPVWPWRAASVWMSRSERQRTRRGMRETPQPALEWGQTRVHFY